MLKKRFKKQKKINSSIGILGYGEVGKAIAKFYKNPKVKDLNRDDGLKQIDILNICVPWSDNFMSIVRKEILEIKPKLVIIHSTVEPGTTKKLVQTINTRTFIVHSPIRGVHPYLYKGIKNFVKYIGTEDIKSGNLAKKHLEELGIKTKIFIPSINTELGKLLSTSYYGLCIAWHGEMKKICNNFGADFEKSVTDFNNTYNIGYKKLKKDKVIRPVLYPPNDCISGHCIIPNAKILEKYFKSQAIDLILRYEKKEKK